MLMRVELDVDSLRVLEEGVLKVLDHLFESNLLVVLNASGSSIKFVLQGANLIPVDPSFLAQSQIFLHQVGNDGILGFIHFLLSEA